MPSRDDHLAQLRHNVELVDHLAATAGDAYLDWCITATFYAALHAVEAYLATRGIHSRNHSERDGWVRSESRLRLIRGHYRTLRDASTLTRYTNSWRNEDLASPRQDLQIIRAHLGV